MPTFPNARPAVGQQSATLFTDALLRTRASITDMNGTPIGNAQIAVDEQRLWPLFKSTASVLYFRGADGRVQTMYPISTQTPVNVTGSRASGAALTSLLTALAAQGIITDGSSA